MHSAADLTALQIEHKEMIRIGRGTIDVVPQPQQVSPARTPCGLEAPKFRWADHER
jgi:hypothetical protein